MATRNYRSWDTISSGYVPKRTYGSYTTQPYYNTYTSYRPYYKSYRSLQDSAAYSPSGTSSSYKFDFVNGRYTNDSGYTTLRDAREPSYYQELTDLYLSTNKLQQDYKNILDRYNSDRAQGYGGGLPDAYGPPKYMSKDRAPPAERYGLYDRRQTYGNRQYDTDITGYDSSHYKRSTREDYHGSVGDVLYNRELHKGRYDVHDTGPRTREDMDRREHTPGDRRADRAGYERDGYHREVPGGYGYDRDGHDSRDPRYGHQDRDGRDPHGHDRYGDNARYPDRDGDRSRDIGDNNRHNDLNGGSPGGGGGGGGLKKSASKHDVDGYTRDKGDRGDKMPGIRDDEYDDDLVGEKGEHGPDDDLLPGMDDDDLFEEEALPEPEPEPEICVYNEITDEEFQQMKEDEAAKEKPLCDFPLIATLTAQLVQVDKIVGEFKRPIGDRDSPVSLSPLPGSTSCYIKSPVPPTGSTSSLGSQDIGMATLNKEAALPGAQNLELEYEDPLKTPLGVSATVVQVGEETTVTETEEEIVEEIPPESTVPEEVHLALDPEMPAEYGDIAAKPEVAPEQAETATEITMTQNEEKEKTNVSTEKVEAVSVKIESEAAEIINKEQSSMSAEEQPKVNGEIKEETKRETKGEVKKEDKKTEERKEENRKKVEKPKSPAAKPKAPAGNSKTPAEKPKSPEKKGRFSKFGQEGSPTPGGSPKKKRLW